MTWNFPAATDRRSPDVLRLDSAARLAFGLEAGMPRKPSKHTTGTAKTAKQKHAARAGRNGRLRACVVREWRYFEFPQFPADGPKLGSILEPKPDPKYTLTDHLWNYLLNYAKNHQAAGNNSLDQSKGCRTGQENPRSHQARRDCA